MAPVSTYDELFAIPVPNNSGGMFTMLEFLESAFLEEEGRVIAECRKQGKLFPADFSQAFKIEPSDAMVRVTCKWKKYRAPVSAHLLRGSYSLTDGHFTGQQAGPAFDTWNPPGEWWERISDEEPLGTDKMNIAMIAFGPHVLKGLLHTFSGKRLPDYAL